MSKLTDLLKLVESRDPNLGRELSNEVRQLINRTNFGLVFERHLPESVDLYGVKPQRGSKVRVIPSSSRELSHQHFLWTVTEFCGTGSERSARLVHKDDKNQVLQAEALVSDLVVVADFNETIYPGLKVTGEIVNSDLDSPFHSVINGENFHALEMLTYTHRHAIDCIYIDPPYNTGAKDWKYNNDYIGLEDNYRHSKWLSMMERRLKVAKELLNPKDSVLIVTIDEKEYLRLGMLLEQVFPETRIQMVSVNIRPSGNSRGAFSRSDEYYYFVMLGEAEPSPIALGEHWSRDGKRQAPRVRWESLLRSGNNGRRIDRPNLFYPVLIDETTGKLHSFGPSLPLDLPKESYTPPDGTIAVFPESSTGEEACWRIGQDYARQLVEDGAFKVGRFRGSKTTFTYLKPGERKKITDGIYTVTGYDENGAMIIDAGEADVSRIPGTQWSVSSHDAGAYGSEIVKALLPRRKFPFPKSLYAVEDALRFFVKNKPDATILDFFAGSGTTAHAVMRLNKQDGGNRTSISITNNEVSSEEQAKLRSQGLNPGDPLWEQWGICDFITKPRIQAAITGLNSDNEPVKGSYRFTDPFPMAEGLKQNARFFSLSYESPIAIRNRISFSRIAPMLWLRAGGNGQIIDDLGDRGWHVSQHYAVIENCDDSNAFFEEVNHLNCKIVFIISDADSQFQRLSREALPGVETIRLYESYLRNFEVNTGRFI